MSILATPPTAPGLARRGIAILYDGILLLALWFAASALLLALSSGLLADPARPVLLTYTHRASLILVTVLFFGGFWTHGGQTLGMRAWRLQLVNNADGGRIRWSQVVLRLAGACLSIGTLGLGFFWQWVDRERRSWHDYLSGTRLILLPKPRAGLEQP